MPTRTLSPAPVELDRWRRDTPGCRDRIHLNNAGAGLMPRPVLEALTEHLAREAAIGGYEAADEAEPLVRETYALVAQLVGAAPKNVALVENATVAFSQALSAFDFRPGDRIVTTRTDYPSNQLMYLSLAQRAGVEVCAELDVPYLVDACQTVGQMAIDVSALRCDFLAATGRKFLRGPRGIGFLYVSDRLLDRGAFPLFLDMRGGDWVDPDAFRLADGARRFENWEFSYALVVGLGAAARYALAAGQPGHERAWRLAALLRERLDRVPAGRVLDRGRERCAIVTLDVRGRDAAELELRLRERGINTSSADRMSGVLDMDEKRAATVLRFSPHYYNTEDELDTAVATLIDLVRR